MPMWTARVLRDKKKRHYVLVTASTAPTGAGCIGTDQAEGTLPSSSSAGLDAFKTVSLLSKRLGFGAKGLSDLADDVQPLLLAEVRRKTEELGDVGVKVVQEAREMAASAAAQGSGVDVGAAELTFLVLLTRMEPGASPPSMCAVLVDATVADEILPCTKRDPISFRSIADSASSDDNAVVVVDVTLEIKLSKEEPGDLVGVVRQLSPLKIESEAAAVPGNGATTSSTGPAAPTDSKAPPAASAKKKKKKGGAPADTCGSRAAPAWNSLECAFDEIMHFVMAAHKKAEVPHEKKGDGTAEGAPVMVDPTAFRTDGKMKEEITNFLVRRSPCQLFAVPPSHQTTGIVSCPFTYT